MHIIGCSVRVLGRSAVHFVLPAALFRRGPCVRLWLRTVAVARHD